MHYINGREAKEFDFVVAKIGDKVYAGRIHLLSTTSSTCNATLVIPGLVTTSYSVTLGTQVLHAEDAWEAAVPTVGND